MFLIAHNASPLLGGGEIWLARLLSGLQRRGHRTLALCATSPIVQEMERHGVPARIFRIAGDAMFPDAIRFAWLLRRLAPDALLFTTFKKAWLGGLGARLARVPRILLRIAISGVTARNFTYRVAAGKFCHRIAINAEEIRAPLLQSLPGLAPERIVLIHDGVPHPLPTKPPGAVKRELAIPETSPVIGAVARIVRQKRFDRLMKALARLPGVHGLLAGEGPERAPLMAMARKNGLAHRLHLPGFRRDVGDVLSALDLFVVCSDREGMANSMLEAMAVGIPVISTPVSGAFGALSPRGGEREAGRIVGFGQNELTAGIRELLGSPELRRRLADHGHRRFEEEFSFERMLHRWEVLLHWSSPR